MSSTVGLTLNVTPSSEIRPTLVYGEATAAVGVVGSVDPYGQ
jgi:hypothetical protein